MRLYLQQLLSTGMLSFAVTGCFRRRSVRTSSF